MTDETEAAIDYLTNPTEVETIVQVPVEFWVHVKNGEVTKFVVSPLESAAYYFGRGSFVFDGPDLELGDNPDTGEQSPFWKAVSEALTHVRIENGIVTNGREVGAFVHWEE